MASTEDFHEEMLSLHTRTGHATGGSYWPGYFLRAVRKDGGLAVAKKLLAPNAKSTGFGRLVEVSRADLSVEAIALDRRFRHLFTDQELDVARKRLAELPPEAFPVDAGNPGARLAEELSEDEVFSDGAATTIRVNRYERDPKARAACLKHFGAKRQACGIDFSEEYGGDIGEGFMHVHHVRPLHLTKASHRIDPRRDLIPVCPNCHAMLHRREPPLDVAQLKARLKCCADTGA